MSKTNYGTILLVSILYLACDAQQQQGTPTTLNPAFNRTIRSYLNFSIPVISCDSLLAHAGRYVLLDAREEEEYRVSHIYKARNIGYQNFDIESIKDITKDQPIVVYCSIGYRSENIGERLEKRGYRNVFNLYGSIFEWANKGYLLVDSTGNPTQRLHTYNQKWSKWVDAAKIEKVW